MKEQFKNLNIPYTRFSAIDGSQLDKSVLLRVYSRLNKQNRHYSWPNIGEIGAYYSHYNTTLFVRFTASNHLGISVLDN